MDGKIFNSEAGSAFDSGSHFEIGLDLCCGELTQVGFFGGPLEARLIPPSRGEARFAHGDDA
jgi:hypothetical protein